MVAQGQGVPRWRSHKAGEAGEVGVPVGAHSQGTRVPEGVPGTLWGWRYLWDPRHAGWAEGDAGGGWGSMLTCRPW